MIGTVMEIRTQALHHSYKHITNRTVRQPLRQSKWRPQVIGAVMEIRTQANKQWQTHRQLRCGTVIANSQLTEPQVIGKVMENRTQPPNHSDKHITNRALGQQLRYLKS